MFSRPIPIVCLGALTLLGILASQPTSASVFPWIPFERNQNWRLIEKMAPEVALRIELIRRAERSIDLIVYDQRCDQEFISPVLSALRDAANRGVKVRFIVSWFGQAVYDHCGSLSTHHYLLDKPTRTPVEYLIFGGPKLKARGWSVFDAVHEKFFIVDGKWAITGGRPFDYSYVHWVDSGFAVKGPLVSQLQESFNRIWDAARSQADLKRSHPYSHEAKEPPAFSLARSKFGVDDREVEKLVSWFVEPSVPEDDSGSPAGRVRVLHNEFIHQLAQAKHRGDLLRIGARLGALEDSVLDAVIERLQTAHRVRMNFLDFFLHPRLKQALLAAKSRGAEITILTNMTGASDVPKGPGGYLWVAALPDLRDAIRAGIDVRAFLASNGGPDEREAYVHRKIAILDDVVFTGSHNFNAPSTFGNDEVTLEIEDPVLAADYAKRLFDEVLSVNSQAVVPARVEHDWREFRPLFPLLDPLLRSL